MHDLYRSLSSNKLSGTIGEDFISKLGKEFDGIRFLCVRQADHTPTINYYFSHRFFLKDAPIKSTFGHAAPKHSRLGTEPTVR